MTSPAMKKPSAMRERHRTILMNEEIIVEPVVVTLVGRYDPIADHIRCVTKFRQSRDRHLGIGVVIFS